MGSRDGMGSIRSVSEVLEEAMSSGSSKCTGPGRSVVATRNASRTTVGTVGAETIWVVILVSGFIDAMVSTI